MYTPDYFLLPRDALTARRARRWLLLGVAALGIAGLFAGLLANTKSPYFYTALVVHVDLSVLVWFLTMACMFCTLAAQGRGWDVLSNAAFWSFAGGALLMALSAFAGGEAYMSNYVPVIHHPVFFLGLALLFCGILTMVVNLFIDFAQGRPQTVQQYGVYCAGILLLYAAGCFFTAHHALSGAMQGAAYYEHLFWDGGHILQFVHTQFMLLCWLWLGSAAGLRRKITDTAIQWLFLFGLLTASCCTLYIYWRFPDVAGDEHRNAFTLMMRHINGFLPLVIGGFLLAGCVPVKTGTSGESQMTVLPKITLLMSMLLFAVGGILGHRIVGSNAIVPAHYHGSIVGITLAYMGVAYLLLPYFGYADVSRSKLTWSQPFIYGGGQLCWIAGMALLGDHGVPRKTPGSADTVDALAAFLKHGGDGLALIGGLLFVFIVLRAVRSRQSAVGS